MRTRLAALGATVAMALTLLAGAPATGADTLSVPPAPSEVSAEVGTRFVRVFWTPSAPASPAVTRYVVHAGPGSCPVTVPATATAALLPIVGGESVIVPRVRAVNAYGYSADAVAPPVDVSGRTNPRFENVQFLQFSDFHGAIESSASAIGAATLAAVFDADRAAVRPTFTVSSGDNIGGSPIISSQFDELPTIEALNLMGLDISTYGNHEHDQPLEHLRRMMAASGFPWVVSNYSSLAPLQVPGNAARDFVILDRGGVQVGFVGMNAPETSELVFPGNLAYGRNGKQTLEIGASAASVSRAAGEARAAGADLVVALVHEGWNQNVAGVAEGELLDLASAFRDVDLVYGAHTHQTYASMVRGRPVTQVRNSGQEYARTQVCLDRASDTVVGTNTEVITKRQLPAITPDARTAALVADYRARLGQRLDQRVGVVAGVFPRGGTPPVERSGQTPLGTLAADALRARYGTDLVILNGGSIRDTLPAAGYLPQDPTLRRPSGDGSGPYDVTLGDVTAVLPFGNNAATSTMTGAQLWRALENGVSGYPTDGRFPQISGFRFTFDPDRPVGSRILSVTLADGTPIARDGRAFTVTTVDYILYGGDGYDGVFDVRGSQMREPYVDTVVAALLADLTAGIVTAVPADDGRITRVR
jgi:2',3'-cyclic-nucleotide 2'-phosphodiesterase (5'-nucleotidase family)